METDDPRVSREQLLYQFYLAVKDKKEIVDWLMKKAAQGAFGEEAMNAYWKGYAKGYAEVYAKNYNWELAKVRGILREMLVQKSNQKFQNAGQVGTELKPQFSRIMDLEGLKQLYLDLDEIADADVLRARLYELTPENKLKANFQTP